jgi:hypothetical protein
VEEGQITRYSSYMNVCVVPYRWTKSSVGRFSKCWSARGFAPLRNWLLLYSWLGFCINVCVHRFGCSIGFFFFFFLKSNPELGLTTFFFFVYASAAELIKNESSISSSARTHIKAVWIAYSELILSARKKSSLSIATDFLWRPSRQEMRAYILQTAR